MIDTGLYTLLSTAPLITALCDTRIYPDVRPILAKYPLIEFKEITGRGDPTFETSGLQRDLYQFDCYGETKKDAALLRDALRQTLNGYTGLLSDGTLLQNADITNKMTNYSDNPRLFCCTLEFHLFYDYPN